jgi:ribosomal protein S19E (S16A)
MNDDFEYRLTPDQWEALKSLRNAASQPLRINRFVVDGLITAGLVSVNSGVPMITPKGRKVLVRGSSALLHDLVA